MFLPGERKEREYVDLAIMEGFDYRTYLFDNRIVSNDRVNTMKHAEIILRTALDISERMPPYASEELALDTFQRYIYAELLAYSALSKRDQRELMYYYIDFLEKIYHADPVAQRINIPGMLNQYSVLQDYLTGLPEETEFDEVKRYQARYTLGLTEPRTKISSVKKKGPPEVVNAKSVHVIRDRPAAKRPVNNKNNTYILLTEYGKDESFRSALKKHTAVFSQDLNGEVSVQQGVDNASVRDMVLTAEAVVRAKRKLQVESRRKLIQEHGDTIMKIIPIGLDVVLDNGALVTGDGKLQATLTQIDNAMYIRTVTKSAQRRQATKYNDAAWHHFKDVKLIIDPKHRNEVQDLELAFKRENGKLCTTYKAFLESGIKRNTRFFRQHIYCQMPDETELQLFSKLMKDFLMEEKLKKAPDQRQRKIVQKELEPYLEVAQKVLEDANTDYMDRCRKAQAGTLLRSSVRLRVNIPHEEEKLALPIMTEIVPRRSYYDSETQEWTLNEHACSIATARNFCPELKDKLENLDRRKRKCRRRNYYVESKLERPLHAKELVQLSRYSDYQPFREPAVHDKEPFTVYNERRRAFHPRTVEVEATIQHYLETTTTNIPIMPLKFLYQSPEDVTSVTMLIDKLGCQWLPVAVNNHCNGRLFLNSQRKTCLLASQEIDTETVICVVLGTCAVPVALTMADKLPILQLEDMQALQTTTYNPLYAPFADALKTKKKTYRVGASGIPNKRHGFEKCSDPYLAEFQHLFYPYPEIDKDGERYYSYANVLGNMYWRMYGPCHDYEYHFGQELASSDCNEERMHKVELDYEERRHNISCNTEVCIKDAINAPYKSLERPFDDALRRIVIDGVKVPQEAVYFHIALNIRIGISSASSAYICSYEERQTRNPAFRPYIVNGASGAITAMLVFQSGIFYLATSNRLLRLWSTERMYQQFQFDFTETLTKEQERFISIVFGQDVLRGIQNPCSFNLESFRCSFYYVPEVLPIEEPEPIDPYAYLGPIGEYESIRRGITISFEDYVTMKQNGDLVKYAKELTPYISDGFIKVMESRLKVLDQVEEERATGEKLMAIDLNSLPGKRKMNHAINIVEAYQTMSYPTDEFRELYKAARAYVNGEDTKPKPILDYTNLSELSKQLLENPGMEIYNEMGGCVVYTPDGLYHPSYSFEESSEEELAVVSNPVSSSSSSECEEERQERKENKINFQKIDTEVSDYMYRLYEDDIFGKRNCPCLYDSQSELIRGYLKECFERLTQVDDLNEEEMINAKIVNDTTLSLRVVDPTKSKWEELSAFQSVYSKLEARQVKNLHETNAIYFVREMFSKFNKTTLQTGAITEKVDKIIEHWKAAKIIPDPKKAFPGGAEKRKKHINRMIALHELLSNSGWNAHVNFQFRKFSRAVRDSVSEIKRNSSSKEAVKSLWRIAEMQVRTSIDRSEWIYVCRQLDTYLMIQLRKYYKLANDKGDLGTLLEEYILRNNEEILKVLDC